MRKVFFVSASLLLLVASSSAQPSSAPLAFVCQDADSGFAQEAETQIAAGIDAERAKVAPNWPLLQHDPELARIARVRACDIAKGLAPFSHTDAAGNFAAGDMVRERFGRFGATGENLIKKEGPKPFDAAQFAKEAVQGWMDSPEHRDNILNPAFRSSGIGVARIGEEAVAAEIFHGPAAPQNHAPSW